MAQFLHFPKNGRLHNMEIITIPEKKIKVYRFKELSEKAKQKVIEDFADINIDYEWWNFDCLLYITDEWLKDRKYISKESKQWLKKNDIFAGSKIKFFDIDRDYYLQMELPIKNDSIFLEILGISKALQKQVNIYYSMINHQENNTTIEFSTENDGNNDTILLDKILENAKAVFDDIISDGLSSLKKDYEYTQSEKAIIETIENNDYQFLKNGESISI